MNCFRCAFALALMSATSIFANGGGYSRGVKSIGAFQPISVDQVQMVSEDLEIDLHLEHALVRINYVLHNPGKRVKVVAGFPSAALQSAFRRKSSESDPRQVAQAELTDFAIAADGQKLDFQVKAEMMELKPSLESNIEVRAWHVVELKFDAGQTRRVSVVYRQNYHGTFVSVSDNERVSPRSLTYLFSAAGLWAGAIERGTVVVRPVTVDPASVAFSHPKRFRREDAVWIWNFRDLEPTLQDDLVIITRPSYSTHYSGEGPAYFEISGGEKKRWETRRAPDAVEASSFLTEPESGVSHPPENAVDHTRETAWAEGVSGDGIGESITLKLNKPVKVSRIGIVNGYAKSTQLYEANNRVAEFAVSVNGGKALTVTVPDEFLQEEHFFFDLPGAPLVTTVKLTIQKVYPGSHYDDTTLSEVVLVVPLQKAPKIGPVR